MFVKKTKQKTEYNEELYREAESKTNIDNVKCLSVLAAIMLLCEFLNEIRVFQVDFFVMRLGAACGMVSYLIPLFIALVYRLRHREEKLKASNQDWFKFILIAFSWFGTIAICVTLTHHTVIVMAIPIILMAQYRNSKTLIPVALLFGTICVLAGVYGGYFFGCFDANLLHVGIDEVDPYNLAVRVELASADRMVELLTHYALARELVVLALIFFATKISNRSDEMIKKQAKLQSAVEQEMQRTNEIQVQIIDGMANLIENRDSSTGEHVKRTSFYVRTISEALKSKENLSDEEVNAIMKAAPLHDIGKIVVTDRILQKPGKLTAEEYEEIKRHAPEGKKVIKNVLGKIEDEEFLRVAEEIAGSHHERWDGNGYPDGKKGKEIPLSARIMAVADVFDALISKRVYKEPMSEEEAFKIIESESGRQFDPEIVEVFLKSRTQVTSFLNSEGKETGIK